MSKRSILVAPNSFKECCSSVKASNLISSQLNNRGFDLFRKPLSDGGDGFLEVIQNNNLKNRLSHYNIRAFDDQLRSIPVFIDNTNLYIESALASGLNLIRKEKRNPLRYNTSALGRLLRLINEDSRSGKIEISKVIIGIGGTATNDFGAGALSELGLTLLDKNGNLLPPLPEYFNQVQSFDWNPIELTFETELVIDVNSPLTGAKGAAYMYAPQKGASPEQVIKLEQGMLNLLNVVQGNIDLTRLSLPGAGGGLAAGLKIFLSSKIKTSAEFIMGDLGLSDYLHASYVITGEGIFDRQSLQDKATGVIIERFVDSKIFIICGVFRGDSSMLPDNTEIIELSKYFKSEEESISQFEKSIARACSSILQKI